MTMNNFPAPVGGELPQRSALEAESPRAGQESTRPCPFCGDLRRPSIEEEEMKFDKPNLFRAVCPCCAAQGPLAITRGSALIMWDERRQPGDTGNFRKLADRLSGFLGESS